MSKDPVNRYSAEEILEYFEKPEFEILRKVVEYKGVKK